jgi:hypothetical protein
MSETFTRADVEAAMKFGELVAKHAKFDVSVPELIQVSRCLVWFNSLPKKIEDNILEVVATHKADEAKVGRVKK